MTNRDSAHLSDDDLLLFLDGEVEKADEPAMREHLAACWTCRARRDDLQATITTVVRAMDEVILPRVPPPPGPWEGLEPHLARLDERLNAERRLVRWRTAVAGALRASRVRWAAVAAVAIVVVSVAWLQQRTVTAAELLAHARPVEQLTARRELVMHERRGPSGSWVARGRIEIWHSATTREKVRRLYDERNALIAGEWTRADGSRIVYRRSETSESGNDLSRATVSPETVWRLELSALTFMAMATDPGHASVDAQPQVFLLSSLFGPAQTARRESGERLSAVILTLSRANLHPIEQSFTFGSGSDARIFRLVESLFTEIPASRIPVAAFVPDAELVGTLAKARVASPRPSAVTRRLSPGELLGLEVEALVRLDGVGALLGEQVSVSRSRNNHVRVDALVETTARKAELMGALDSLSPRWGIDLEIQTFAEAQQRAPVRPDGAPVVRSVEMTDVRAPVYDDLQRYFAQELAREAHGDSATSSAPASQADTRLDKEIQAFTGRVLEHALQARLHARALTQAVARVSAEDLRALDAERAQAWRALIRDHATALRRETESLRRSLQPVFFATPPAPLDGAVATDQDTDVWQTVARLFGLASAHDVAVGQAFAVSATGATPVYLKSKEFWHSLRSSEQLAGRLQTAVAPRRPPGR